MLVGQPDEKIEAVHALSVGPSVDAETRRLPWEVGLFRLFASHRADDKVLVSEVKQALANVAIDVFVAHEDIEPSEEWLQIIDASLGSCDALAAFLTPAFHSSEWCDQEVGFAIRSRVLIIPVNLGTVPYGFMNRYQALRATGLDAARIASGIFRILTSNSLTMPRMAEAIVAHVVASNSFDEANQRSELLANVRQWTPALLRQLEESIESNSQIAGSYKAPGRIKAIVRKFSN